MRIGILTGGGDVPGLNAAIRAVARRAFDYGWEVYGIYDGWKGLRDGIIAPLSGKEVSGILHKGGTILGSSRTNITKRPEDMEQSVAHVRKFGLDAIVAIGGDDTLGVCAELVKQGVPAVGIPKTMDNDVYGTDHCIGFNTAVTTVADALDKLHTTAESHHRIIIVEVMGRYTGWVAVMGGLAGGADYILIPEKPATIDELSEHIQYRWERGKKFSIVVVAEAAKISDVRADEEEAARQTDEFGHIRLDRRGLASTLATVLEERTGFETRFVVLGHVQRGGSPTVFDRVLATRLGVRAADLIKEGKFGYMAAMQGSRVVAVPLQEVANRKREVDEDLCALAQMFY
ncbi:MAG: 6-phosphofructokinase [Anaerolineales bacterium]|nr:MAG: 6-phosphofructokinase [Anaerolineales bacterium]